MNLTHPQFVVLASLAYLSQNNIEVTQVMISKISGIDVMTVSQILNLLEKHNFVKRKVVRKSMVDIEVMCIPEIVGGLFFPIPEKVKGHILIFGLSRRMVRIYRLILG